MPVRTTSRSSALARPVILATLLLTLVPLSARGQSGTGSFGVLAGATFPSGDLNDELETGFNLGVTLGFTSPILPVALRIDAAWHQLSLVPHLGHGSERLRILTGSANLVYTFQLPFRPYAIGGAGAYNLRHPHSAGDENEFGWNLGAGMRVPVLPFETVVELRFHRILAETGDMTLVPISVGVMF